MLFILVMLFNHGVEGYVPGRSDIILNVSPKFQLFFFALLFWLRPLESLSCFLTFVGPTLIVYVVSFICSLSLK